MPKITASILLLSILLAPGIVLALQLDSGQAQEKTEIPSPLQSMWNWVKEKALFVYDKIYFVLSKEVEQRKPGVEDEFKKETEEMKQEIEKEAPSWWQRLKDLVK